MKSRNGSIKIIEVGPRDGLQNEKEIIPAPAKARFIELLAASGLRHIEATSFVRADRIPQLADAAEVLHLLQQSAVWPLVQRGELNLCALVPNRRGLDEALAAGLREVAVFTAASDDFTRKNTNCTVAESLDRIAQIMPVARSLGLAVRGYVSTVVECPYAGRIEPETVLSVVRALVDMGIYEISLGETLGVAVPVDIAQLLDVLLPAVPVKKLAGHFHNTRGTALANVFKSLEYGLRAFDSSAGGLGGCPYAPGAAGNLATEDLVYALEREGFDTGVDLDRLGQATSHIQDQFSRVLRTC